MARYTPLENAQGEVIGAIFVGVDVTQDIVNLKARLAKVRVGDSGQLHVLALDGPQRGQFVLHPSLNGKNALALRDHHDQPVYAPMLDAPQGARRVTPAGTSSPHLLRYAAYQDWRWLLISDELHDEINAENQLILFWLLAGLGVLLVLLVAAMALSSRRLVSQPLGALALAFNRLLDAFQQALRTTLSSAQQQVEQISAIVSVIDPVRGKPRRSGRGRMARTAWPSLPSMGVGCIKYPVCNAFKPTNTN